MIKKNTRITSYNVCYTKLLREHFEEDYSLSEIAKRHNISRQAVYDNIRRGIKILKEYEDKIGFYKREKEIKEQLIELRENYRIDKLDELIESFED